MLIPIGFWTSWGISDGGASIRAKDSLLTLSATARLNITAFRFEGTSGSHSNNSNFSHLSWPLASRRRRSTTLTVRSSSDTLPWTQISNSARSLPTNSLFILSTLTQFPTASAWKSEPPSTQQSSIIHTPSQSHTAVARLAMFSRFAGCTRVRYSEGLKSKKIRLGFADTW